MRAVGGMGYKLASLLIVVDHWSELRFTVTALSRIITQALRQVQPHKIASAKRKLRLLDTKFVKRDESREASQGDHLLGCPTDPKLGYAQLLDVLTHVA